MRGNFSMGRAMRIPPDSLLRFEEILLGGEDESLWRHLAAEPERVLDLVDHYLKLGGWDEARRLLERANPEVTEQEAEPKALRPQQHPLILNYRGYVKERTGGTGGADYARASRAAVEYIFPNRPSSVVVLQTAIRQNASDATAQYLLGCLGCISARQTIRLPRGKRHGN